MTKATPESPDSLVFECDLDEPPEKVWRALTEPQLLEAWLMADDAASANAANAANGAHPPGEAERPYRAGGADEAEHPPSPGAQPSPRRARDLDILTAEPHRLLRYRWRDRENGAGDSSAREVDSVVTFELAPDPGGGTHLRLTHGQFRIVTTVGSTLRRKTPILSSAAQSYLRQAA